MSLLTPSIDLRVQDEAGANDYIAWRPQFTKNKLKSDQDNGKE